jgi:hypothetical protein
VIHTLKARARIQNRLAALSARWRFLDRLSISAQPRCAQIDSPAPPACVSGDLQFGTAVALSTRGLTSEKEWR